LLSADGVDRLSGCLQNLMTDELTALLVVLKTQCHDQIRVHQTKYVGLNTQCKEAKTNLAIVETNVSKHEESIAKVQAQLISMQNDLAKEQQRVLDAKKTYSKSTNKKEEIEQQLQTVDGMVKETILFHWPPLPPSGPPSSAHDKITNFDQDSVLYNQIHLNDNAIKFFLKLVQDELPRDHCIYMCPYDFYSTYRQRCENFNHHGERDRSVAVLPMKTQQTKYAYDSISTRLEGNDLFNSDFVVVPIKLDLHWSVMVICHPGQFKIFLDYELDHALKMKREAKQKAEQISEHTRGRNEENYTPKEIHIDHVGEK